MDVGRGWCRFSRSKEIRLNGELQPHHAPPLIPHQRDEKQHASYSENKSKYTKIYSHPLPNQKVPQVILKSIMSRPGVARTASTNLGSGNGYRVLDGKVAVVTGASRGMLVKNPNRDTTEQECTGIGAATCENLASKGCSLIMNYTSDSSESITVELAERLSKEHGIKALPVQADMGTENGPAHLIATALNHFAHPKTRKLQIDIIINNAGVASNRAIDKCDVEDFDFVYRVNVRGPLFLMKAAIPYLPTDRSGRIVNVSSVSASCGFSEQSVYGGSKAAVEAMTRTWARELAERCTVNAINPGPVLTGKCLSSKNY